MAGILLLPLWVCAQGVNFRPLSYTEAIELAAKENKMVFIDFYTTWCGPCKRMSKEVFPQQEVGEYFNRTFISLKLDAEKENGLELAKKYAVKAFPTFVVLSPDGTEVFRTSGYRPADEFVEKIRKGIDPRWSPAGLTKRYEKGERTPQLVDDYATLLLEQGKTNEGFGVINDYFNRLSARKKVKPENFFLYERYTLNFDDPKAQYVFDNREQFVRANGKEIVDKLLYSWLRIRLIPYFSLRSPEPVTAEGLQKLKTDIEQVKLTHTRAMPDLLAIADVRMGGNVREYLEICKEKFPVLEDQDRFLILLDLEVVMTESQEVKQLAVDLLRSNMQVADEFHQRILRMKMLELEGKKDFTLQAEIDAVEKGKVIVMGRKTLESLPAGQPLAGRKNVVLTRDEAYKVKGCEIFHNLKDAMEFLKQFKSEDIYIIGGAEIYEAFLPYCDTAHITWIDYEYMADTWLPNLDKDPDWEVTADSDEQTYFDLCYEFRRYERTGKKALELGEV